MSERRCRLLGIDAPVITKSELTGSLGVYAEKLEAERELFGKLSLEQLEEFAAASQALVDRAMAMVRANASPTLVGAAPAPAEQSPGTDVARSADRALPVGVSPSPAAAVDDAATGKAPDSLPQPR